MLLSWVIIYFVLIKGINSLGKASSLPLYEGGTPRQGPQGPQALLGKQNIHTEHQLNRDEHQVLYFSFQVMYVVTIFPYIMLTVLLIRGCTLEGAWVGIEFYLKPEFDRLTDGAVSTQLWLQRVRMAIAFYRKHFCRANQLHKMRKVKITLHSGVVGRCSTDLLLPVQLLRRPYCYVQLQQLQEQLSQVQIVKAAAIWQTNHRNSQFVSRDNGSPPMGQPWRVTSVTNVGIAFLGGSHSVSHRRWLQSMCELYDGNTCWNPLYD